MRLDAEEMKLEEDPLPQSPPKKKKKKKKKPAVDPANEYGLDDPTMVVQAQHKELQAVRSKSNLADQLDSDMAELDNQHYDNQPPNMNEYGT